MKTIHSTFAAALFLALSAAQADSGQWFKVGDQHFGAEGRYDFVDNVSADTYKADFKAYADGYVLKKSIRLGSGSIQVDASRSGTTHASGSLKIGGSTLASYSKTFNGSADFQTAPFFQAQTGGEAVFVIGFVPVRLKADAEIKVYGRGKIGVTWSPTTRRPIIEISAGPALDAAASASAGVDYWLASISLEAGLAINGYGINGVVKYIPRSTGSYADVILAVTADTVSTNGHITGKIKIGRGWASYTQKHTFYKYEGGPTSTTLAQFTRRI